uniref:Bm10995 n=1 Tax=Brugia malayi TaxID=6279 RepID=A0A0H5SBF5_BRUMA|nr:Bm10995 [Brugia malayi]
MEQFGVLMIHLQKEIKKRKRGKTVGKGIDRAEGSAICTTTTLLSTSQIVRVALETRGIWHPVPSIAKTAIQQ